MLTGMKVGDYLFIQFGINDGSACPRHVGTTLFQTYLVTMAKAASDRAAQAIFLSPTNAIACSGSTAQANTRGTYPAATKTAATTANVPFIDVTTLSADHLGDLQGTFCREVRVIVAEEYAYLARS